MKMTAREYFGYFWKIAVGIFVFAVLCRVIAIPIVWLLPDSVVANYEGKEVRAGEIVDKEIINASSSWFASGEEDYRIIIQFDYEKLGQAKNGTKSISVDKETYLRAEVGMWFDSRTLGVTDRETNFSASLPPTCLSCGNELDADDKICPACGTATGLE